jgi:hypothetical protein
MDHILLLDNLPGLRLPDFEQDDAARPYVHHVQGPERTGTFAIPPIEVPHFDPALGRYEVARTQPLSIDVAPSAAAGIGWAIGNLHLELQSEPTRLLAPDEPAVRQLLDRLKISFTPTTAIFRPGRFSRGQQPTHDLGTSHRH